MTLSCARPTLDEDDYGGVIVVPLKQSREDILHMAETKVRGALGLSESIPQIPGR